MSRLPVGTRVGVILGTRGDVIEFVGYGKYVGDEVPPPTAGGFNSGAPNPKLVLDDGQVCWGCETWWGPEETIKAKLEAAKDKGQVIKMVNMDEERAKS